MLPFVLDEMIKIICNSSDHSAWSKNATYWSREFSTNINTSVCVDSYLNVRVIDGLDYYYCCSFYFEENICTKQLPVLVVN